MRKFRTLEEKEKYGRSVFPRVLLFGGGWMTAWGIFGDYFHQDWTAIPMVLGFMFLVMFYYLV